MGTSGNTTFYRLLVKNNTTGKFSVEKANYQWSFTYDDDRGWEDYLEKEGNFKIIEMKRVGEFDKDLDYYDNNPKMREERDSKLEKEWKETEKKWAPYLENPTNYGFKIIADNPDDIIIEQYGKPILKVSLPERSTQWNTKLP